MANKTLQSNAWNVGANWAPVATVPVTGDNVLIPDTLGVAVDDGLDQNGVLLARLVAAPLSRFPVGAAASPLQLNATLVEYYGSGGFFFEARDDASTPHDTAEVVIQAFGAQVAVQLSSFAVAGSASNEFSILRLMRGNVTLDGSLLFTAGGNLQVGFVNNPSSDVKCTIASGADDLPMLDQTAGLVESSRAITLAVVCNARLIQDVGAIGTLNIHSGGVVEYKHTSATVINLYSGGVLDLTKKVGFQTITTLNRFSGTRVLGINNQVTITNYNRYDEVYTG